MNSSYETEQRHEQDVRLSLNCGVCRRSQHRNAKNMPEAFIRCYSCRRRGKLIHTFILYEFK